MLNKASLSRVENKKKEIITAAWKIFRKYGYKKATIVEIGNEIGQSQASIYYYFKNKEEIYISGFLNEMEQLIVKYDEIKSKKLPIAEKIIKLLSLRLKYFYENIIMQQLADLNLNKVSQNLKSRIFINLELEQKTIKNLLDEAKRNGEIDPPDPAQTTKILIHISQGIRFGTKFKFLLSQQKPQLDDMLVELEEIVHSLFEKWEKNKK